MNRRTVRATIAAALGLILLAATAPQPAAAQATGVVRGTVVETGTRRGLGGVQVFVKGTARGRLTDMNGSFVLADVPAGALTLRVESIGYRAMEKAVTVAAGETAAVDFELQPTAVGLDEIVITGTAGGAAKRGLGNSVSSINAAKITEAAPITNVQQMIQGRAAGVSMIATTGVVGGSSRTRIRGPSSLEAGNEPVVFVDGVRVQSGTVRTEGNTAQGINLLEAFNPHDIESIEIIKGPAAATLYGAEAATGVIQIITKKGRPAEGLQWSANFEYGQVDWAVDRITTYWLCSDARMSALATNPGCRVFDTSQPVAERLLVDRPLDPSQRSLAVREQYRAKADSARAAGDERLALAFENEDYPCIFFQQQPCEPRPLRTGDTRNMNISVRGGGESYNFFVSAEKNDENGTFFNNFSNRKGGRANFGFTPSQQANFTVNVGYAIVEQRLPQSDNSSNSVLRNAYRGQAGGANSQYLPGFRNFHPEFSNKYDRAVSQERLTLGITGNYNPFSWWENRLTVGLDRSDRMNDLFFQIDQTGRRPFGAINATGAVTQAFNEVFLWTVDYNARLSRQLSDQFSSALAAGMQLTKRRGENHTVTGNGLVANRLNLISSAANRNVTDHGFTEQTSLGFYVEERVGWRDRLFATAAVRVDDNSAFGRDFQLVVYPKAQLSYVISEEPFFNLGWVDELKLRFAWGQAGNAPAPFSADRTYEAGRAIVDDAPLNTLSTSAYGNPDLKAETGSEFEAGFDASLFAGRLGANVTAYHKVTKDALLEIEDPPSSGWIDDHLINVGEFKNTGLEVSLDAALLRHPRLNWDVVVAFATNSNELVSFGKDRNGNPVLIESRFGDFLDSQRHREGYPMGGYWAVDVKRDANGRPILSGPNADSDCLSDAGVFTCTASIVECDWSAAERANCQEEFVGSPFPTRSLGLTNTFRILNNVQIHSFFDYQGGFYQWCAICSVRTRIDGNTKQINDARLDPSDPEWTTFGMYERARLLSLQTKEFIYRADFVKLRELGLTYTLPRKYTERIGFSRAAFTVSGRNLAIWTKYRGNADPEVNFTSDAAFTTSDYGSIPMQRRLLISTNFSF